MKCLPLVAASEASAGALPNIDTQKKRLVAINRDQWSQSPGAHRYGCNLDRRHRYSPV
jgi:hypothetical protein